jgi:hypothetical protein
MDPTLTTAPHSDPTLVYRYRDGLYAADLFIVGLHLDFFSWLGAHPSTLAGVCAAHGFAARPADVMLTLFSAMSLIHQRDGVFALTETGREHLTGGSPWNLKALLPVARGSPDCQGSARGAANGQAGELGGAECRQGLAPIDGIRGVSPRRSPRRWTAAASTSRSRLPRPLTCGASPSPRHRRRIGDLRLRPGRPQLPSARDRLWTSRQLTGSLRQPIAKRGVADQGVGRRRDMLVDPLPPGPDVHLFSNVLHDWDTPVIEDLLRKSFDALPAGGLVVVHEAFLNAEKTGPLHVASTRSSWCTPRKGRCYSVAEMEGYLSAAGFSGCAYVSGAAARGIMTARK